ncbi:MAG: LysE family translocator [Alphaproteobacteria bacterium]|jgi:homoserine/homoserine lactone efflux protein|nr:LysE family translocator [Alphaproteobacteria bacterium]
MFGMEIPVLAAFIATATAIIISPGPDTIIILRHAINGGRGPGLAAVGGVQLGLVVHTALAVAGISLIIASTPALLQGVAILGAAYLAWIGIQSLKGGGGLSFDVAGNASGSGRAMREAVLCNLLNPKVILLFLALFPNFVDYQRGDVSTQLITLAVILIVINTLWQAPMALAANALRRWLANPATRLAVNRASGGILLVMAALMLAQNLL